MGEPLRALARVIAFASAAACAPEPFVIPLEPEATSLFVLVVEPEGHADTVLTGADCARALLEARSRPTGTVEGLFVDHEHADALESLSFELGKRGDLCVATVGYPKSAEELGVSPGRLAESDENRPYPRGVSLDRVSIFGLRGEATTTATVPPAKGPIAWLDARVGWFRSAGFPFVAADSCPGEHQCFVRGATDAHCQSPCPYADEPTPPAPPTEACPLEWRVGDACAPVPAGPCAGVRTPGRCVPPSTCPGPGEWSADLPAAIHVRAGAPPGGSGSRGAPLATLSDGLAALGEASGTVLLGPGTYALELTRVPEADVVLRGACPAETVVVAGDGTLGLGTLALERLTLEGGPVYASNSNLTLTEAVSTAPLVAMSEGALRLARSRVGEVELGEAGRLVAEAVELGGLWVGASGTATLTQSIAGSATVGGSLVGAGVALLAGLRAEGRGARVRLTRLGLLDGPTGRRIRVQGGARVAIAQAELVHREPALPTGGAGVTERLVSVETATLTLSDAKIEVVGADGLPLDQRERFGVLHAEEGSFLRLTRVELTGGTGAGIVAERSHVRATDLRVRATGVYGLSARSAGTRVRLARARFEALFGAAIFLESARLAAEDLHVAAATRTADCPSAQRACYGYGVMTYGSYTEERGPTPPMVALDRFRLQGCDGIGLALGGGANWARELRAGGDPPIRRGSIDHNTTGFQMGGDRRFNSALSEVRFFENRTDVRNFGDP